MKGQGNNNQRKGRTDNGGTTRRKTTIAKNVTTRSLSSSTAVVTGGPRRKRLRASCASVETALNKRLDEQDGILQQTLDNGGHPFTVFIEKPFKDNGFLNAMVVCTDFEGESSSPLRLPGVVYTSRSVDCVWFGSASYDDDGNVNPAPPTLRDWEVGNSVLIVDGRTCVAVSSKVVRFTLAPGESVTSFISAVGNSAATYGWIETTKGVYFIDGFNCMERGAAYFLPWGEVEGKSPTSSLHLDCIEEKAGLFRGMKRVRSATYLI